MTQHELWQRAIRIRNLYNEIIDGLDAGKEVNFSDLQQTHEMLAPLVIEFGDELWSAFIDAP